MASELERERQRRFKIWEDLSERGGPLGARPALLNELGIFRGGRGIWYDKVTTRDADPSGSGITVGLLHTGSHYADDLSDQGALYHYPRTQSVGKDKAEVAATKSAGELRLPLFLVAYPSPSSGLRDVHLGWIEGWDDDSELFLVNFAQDAPDGFVGDDDLDDEPFELVEERSGNKTRSTARKGQQRFHFRVFKRYGPKCAVCGIGAKELLEAIHIRPRSKNGSNDPRNGLVLCRNHHRAFDEGLFCFDPDTLGVVLPETGPGADGLRLEATSLHGLPKKPHREALQWRSQRRC